MAWLPQGNHQSEGKHHQGQEKIDTIFVRLLLRVIIAYKMPPAWPGYQKVTTFLTA
jgi:hypothetical protein